MKSQTSGYGWTRSRGGSTPSRRHGWPGKLGQLKRDRPGPAKQARTHQVRRRLTEPQSRKLLEARSVEGVRVAKQKGTGGRRRLAAGRRTARRNVLDRE